MVWLSKSADKQKIEKKQQQQQKGLDNSQFHANKTRNCEELSSSVKQLFLSLCRFCAALAHSNYEQLSIQMTGVVD